MAVDQFFHGFCADVQVCESFLEVVVAVDTLEAGEEGFFGGKLRTGWVKDGIDLVLVELFLDVVVDDFGLSCW